MLRNILCRIATAIARWADPNAIPVQDPVDALKSRKEVVSHSGLFSSPRVAIIAGLIGLLVAKSLLTEAVVVYLFITVWLYVVMSQLNAMLRDYLNAAYHREHLRLVYADGVATTEELNALAKGSGDGAAQPKTDSKVTT